MTGSARTRLVIVRGPSGSGKSTVARDLRERMGRGTALVEQDYLRRKLLWEKDTPGALNISLIDAVARHVLDAGYDAVVEGILHEPRYGDMLRALVAHHAGSTVVAYLDVSFEETVRRHAGRPQATEFTPEQMATWWAPDDRLGLDGEVVIGPRSTASQTADLLVTALDDTCSAYASPQTTGREP
ncbi:AAA family ATPase [Promicromonospora umidemergens]|nr:AAA family ATPase [Promicromonospora umidemergens]